MELHIEQTMHADGRTNGTPKEPIGFWFGRLFVWLALAPLSVVITVLLMVRLFRLVSGW